MIVGRGIFELLSGMPEALSVAFVVVLSGAVPVPGGAVLGSASVVPPSVALVPSGARIFRSIRCCECKIKGDIVSYQCHFSEINYLVGRGEYSTMHPPEIYLFCYVNKSAKCPTDYFYEN